ncbi:DeoR family transcriptional regulator [Bradyrhizobium sp. KBS0727]|uniref:DeoR family transcriptional regulator n=1 Tax=unclassified Bradyrhizobium TaxID=2631580 RepID=UPI00110EB3AA|nr:MULTISPECIES: DeoR family transcriptional regulator [unclassified Bradyrhizobium]QDW37768.1 DeoR family transcriptional regulator [Bradyrhizobium sp. KBS0725]QDW44372.1 DeoR family transcriptional regulator [Bradyrhizobium sp. KBS0727]
MLPKKGRKLPLWTGVLGGRATYARTIADLLHKEHGDSHRSIKQLMRQTDASERTVKHWLSAQHGPDTVYFLRLVVSSRIIRAFVLGLIESPAANPLSDPVDRFSLAAARKAYVAGEAAGGRSATDTQKNVSENVSKHVPINVPDPVELSERQRWFLIRVAEGGRCSAKEIVAKWGVSLKTARRDIGALQKAQLLEYVGSRRKGRYRRKMTTYTSLL